MEAFSDHRVTVGGKAVTLRFGFNAFAAFEATSGVSAFRTIARLETGNLEMASELRVLCWAAMLHHQPQASLDDAGSVLDAAPGCVTRALGIAMPNVQEGGGDRPAKKPMAAFRILQSFWRAICARVVTRLGSGA